MSMCEYHAECDVRDEIELMREEEVTFDGEPTAEVKLEAWQEISRRISEYFRM